jgi:hypothetical protein
MVTQRHGVPSGTSSKGGTWELQRRSAVLRREKRGREMERSSWTRGAVCSGEPRRSSPSYCGGCEPSQGLPRRALEAGSCGGAPVKTERWTASFSGRKL